MTYTFGGLNPSSQYNLFGIFQADGNGAGRVTTFTVGSTSQSVTSSANWTSNTVKSLSTYTEFINLTPSGSGQIVVNATDPTNEIGVNGLQLRLSRHPFRPGR